MVPTSTGRRGEAAMRCFTVTESAVSEGIAVTQTPYAHIGVGEEGRGREYVRVALGKRDFPEGTVRIGAASVLKTRERGTLLVVAPCPGDDRRALALVDIAAGFRGGTAWTGVTTDVAPCPNRGKPRGYDVTDHAGECNACGAIVPEDGVHADEGTVTPWPAFPPAGITVLAEGARAQGDAGRMGGHAVRLLIMEPGAMFRVVRSGRLYGAPSKRYVRWTGERMELGTFDELFPPSAEDTAGAVAL